MSNGPRTSQLSRLFRKFNQWSQQILQVLVGNASREQRQAAAPREYAQEAAAGGMGNPHSGDHGDSGLWTPLVRLQERLWADGQRPAIEDLLADNHVPRDQLDQILLELIVNEVLLREQQGEEPTLDEYQYRFPELSEPLAIQWQIDHLLKVDHDLMAAHDPATSGTDEIHTAASDVVSVITDESANRKRRIGRYELQDEVGRGGIGVVHRAWDPQLKRMVALKRLRTGSDATVDDLKRFRNEAESIARLRHPNIVQIFDVGEHQGLPFLAMEFCKGGTLAEFLRGQPLPPADAANLVMQIAEGVAAANAQGVIHRDLKPANVLLDERQVENEERTGGTDCAKSNVENGSKEVEGRITVWRRLISETRAPHQSLSSSWSFKSLRSLASSSRKSSTTLRTASPSIPTPKVSDFGLAKLLGEDAGATATGHVVGTPAYMSPEQARGESKRVGAAVDVYSLGAILYECLTGRPPFRGASVAETIQRVMQDEPLAVRALEPRVPLDLETITHKCLRKSPTQRYATCAALADDLRRFLNYHPILARRERWWQAASRISRRYPLAVSLSAVSVGLLITIAIGSLVFAQWLNQARIAAERFAREAQLGQAEALVGRAHGIRLSRRSGQRFEALNAIRHAAAIGKSLDQPPEWFTPIRDEAIAALLLPDVYLAKQWTQAEPIVSADLSDDRSRYAVSFASGDILIKDSATEAEIARIPRSFDGSVYLRFIGKSKLIVRGDLSDASIELWSVDDKVVRRLWTKSRVCESLDVSTDDSKIATISRDAINVLDSETGKVLAAMASAPFTRSGHIHLHPSQPFVLLHSYFTPQVQVRNWETGELVMEVKPGESRKNYPGYSGANWSPDGREFVVVNGHFDVTYWYAFDPLTGAGHILRTTPQDYPAQSGAGAEVRYAPEGDRLFRWGWANQVELLEGSSARSLARSLPIQSCFLKAGSTLNNFRVDATAQPIALFRIPNDAKSMGTLAIADGREFQPLATMDGPAIPTLAFDPRNQVYVLFGEGFMILDRRTLRPLFECNIKLSPSPHSSQFDSVGNLYTAGYGGCFRWPFRRLKSETTRLEIGVPKRFELPPGQVTIVSNNDGTVIGAGIWNGFGTASYAGCWLKSAVEPAFRRVRADESGAILVSPDGSTALASLGGSNEVWDTDPLRRTGTSFELSGHLPCFSRDGRWWMAGATRMPAGTWRPSPPPDIGTPCSLSDDGRYTLTVDTAGIVGMLNAETGRILARFEAPFPCQLPRFSPSGDAIVCVGEDRFYRSMDLRRIRDQLQKLGLDWNAPPLLPLPSSSQPTGLDISLAPELRKVRTFEEFEDVVDHEALTRADREPDSGEASFDAAMADVRIRELNQALVMLDRACKLMPTSLTSRQWRAYVYAERGEFANAIADATWVLQQIDDEDLRLRRAEWHLRQGNYADGITDCTSVMENRPFLGRLAVGLRGLCFASQGNMQQAEVDRHEFLKTTRDDVASLQISLAPMVGYDLSQHCPKLALLLAEKMVSRGQDLESDHFLSIGLAYLRNDHLEEAIRYLQRARDESHGVEESEAIEAAALFALAIAHQQLGQSDLADDMFYAASAWHPTTAPEAMLRELIRCLRFEAAPKPNRSF